MPATASDQVVDDRADRPAAGSPSNANRSGDEERAHQARSIASATTATQPPPEMSALATRIFELVSSQLPATTTLESIAATPYGVVLVLRSPSLQQVREVVATLVAEANVHSVTPAGMNPSNENTSSYKVILVPKRP